MKLLLQKRKTFFISVMLYYIYKLTFKVLYEFFFVTEFHSDL